MARRINLSIFTIFTILTILTIFGKTSQSQSPFSKQTERTSLGQNIKWPWLGGVNACQFVEMDLNLDGVPDLMIFDRHGNRKLTFLTTSVSGSKEYTPAPEYAGKLPDIHDWIITADYNCDGKMDIFVAGYGNNTIATLLNDGAGVYTNLVTYGSTQNPIAGVARDFNGDGRIDLAFCHYYGS